MSRIVLGVTGGIAAYKAVLVLRLLTEAGHEVRVVPTENALRMVGAATWQALSHHEVHTSVFDDPTGVEHVALGQWAEAVVVAPATANFLARCAAGAADDLLSTTVLMAGRRVLLFPAMHTEMWSAPATAYNVQLLRARGVRVFEPAVGRLTGPDSGPGRLPEPEHIAAAVAAFLGAGASAPDSPTAHSGLAGTRVVVSAGGTREPIDPVRFLGNRSSGRQGVELARAARAAGAEVELVAANVDDALLAGLDVAITRVTTTEELAERMLTRALDADVLVMAAAVADYRPTAAQEHKLKKSAGANLVIELEETPDILRTLVERRRDGQTVVGFAAETGDGTATALEHATAKARRKGADLLVFNEVSDTRGFGDVPNDVVVLDAGGTAVETARGSKAEVARALVALIAHRRGAGRLPR